MDLFRQIYGLRRTFPIDLIYSPEDVGGCGKSRLSDIAQLLTFNLSPWLKSCGHCLSLLRRALNASVTNSPFYCTSVI